MYGIIASGVDNAFPGPLNLVIPQRREARDQCDRGSDWNNPRIGAA